MRYVQLIHLLELSKKTAAGKLLATLYQDEIKTANKLDTVEFKNTSEIVALFEAAQYLSPVQRQRTGIDDVEVWSPEPRATQLPPGVTTSSPSAPGVQNDEILRFRFQSLKDSGLCGSLTYEQFLRAQGCLEAPSAPPKADHNGHKFTDTQLQLVRDNTNELAGRILANNIDGTTITHALTEMITISQRQNISIHPTESQTGPIRFDEGTEILLIPILTGNNWSLMAIQAQSMTFYDSIPCNNNTIFTRINRRLEPSMDPLPKCRIAPHRLQTGNDYSGLYLLLNALAHIRGWDDPLELYGNFSIPSMSKWMALVIIQQNLLVCPSPTREKIIRAALLSLRSDPNFNGRDVPFESITEAINSTLPAGTLAFTELEVEEGCDSAVDRSDGFPPANRDEGFLSFPKKTPSHSR